MNDLVDFRIYREVRIRLSPPDGVQIGLERTEIRNGLRREVVSGVNNSENVYCFCNSWFYYDLQLGIVVCWIANAAGVNGCDLTAFQAGNRDCSNSAGRCCRHNGRYGSVLTHKLDILCISSYVRLAPPLLPDIGTIIHGGSMVLSTAEQVVFS